MPAHSTRGRGSKAYGTDLRGAFDIETGHGIDWQAPAGQKVLDAAQNQRAAQARLAFPELIVGEPASADDATVERLRRPVIAD
jgi:hypothetical protein